MKVSRLWARLRRRPVAPANVTLTIARVPDATPAGDTLKLGANVNGWKPERPGFAFTRDDQGRYQLTLAVEPGTTLQYKVTRGSWASVECAADGTQLPNRELDVEGDATVTLEVAEWADLGPPRPPKPHTVTGDVELIEGVASPQLGNTRTLAVYLPPGYHQGDKRYPVLYLHDGQNLFDEATAFAGEWCADETAEDLARRRGLEVILVGLYNNADRLKEYAPFPAPENDQTALGQPYAAFVATTVKPLIDARYRTLADRPHTGILGSSMGGLISLYTALSYPDLFGFVGAMSPSFWFAGSQMYGWVKDHPVAPMKIYLDVGDSEEGESPAGTDGFVTDTRQMGQQLEAQGHQVTVVVARGGTHSEGAWSLRFPGALVLFLTGTWEKVKARLSRRFPSSAAARFGPRAR